MSTFCTIGQLARQTGTRPETIRYYEKVGLLAPAPRSASGYRHYGEDARRRLSFVRQARSFGFSLEQIRELLGLADQRDLACTGIDATVREHLADIARRIDALRELQTELERMLDTCPGGRTDACRVLEALQAPGDADMGRDPA